MPRYYTTQQRRPSGKALYTIVTALTIYIAYIFISVLTYQEAQVLYDVVLNTWLIGLIIFSCIFMIYGFKHTVYKFKQHLYKAIFSLFEKANYPCLVLDKKLNILFVNTRAQKDFFNYQYKIKRALPGFEYERLISGEYNFKQLDPKKSNFNTTQIFLNSNYTNKYNYKNLAFNFKSRIFRVYGIKLGIIIEYDFTTSSKKLSTTNKLQRRIKNSTIAQSPRWQYEQEKDYLKTMNNNRVKSVLSEIDSSGEEIQTESIIKLLEQKNPRQQFGEEYSYFKQKADNIPESEIQSQNQLLEDLKLKIVNLMLQSKANNEANSNSTPNREDVYLELYKSLENIISLNKSHQESNNQPTYLH